MGPTHGVTVYILIFIGNVCGLPKGWKYPEKSRNKRKFALPCVLYLLWDSKRLIRAIWTVLRSWVITATTCKLEEGGYGNLRNKTNQRNRNW